MINSPKVSVIVPLYNAENYINACIDSILAQTLTEIEVVIVDDCSTDGSLKLCWELYGGDERVVFIQHPRNSGFGFARNTGIKEARGKYIAFADSDDQMLPEHLKSMYDTAEKYNADVVHSSGFLVCKEENSPVNMLTLPRSSFMAVSLNNTPVKNITVVSGSERETTLRKWTEHYYHCSLWNKLFRRDMLINDGIEFIDSARARTHIS